MFEWLQRWRTKRRVGSDWRATSAEVLEAKQKRVAAIRAADEVATVDALEELLFRHDPVGINFGENTDEYRPEAETITLRRADVASFEDLRRVVHEEFVRWFGSAIADRPSGMTPSRKRFGSCGPGSRARRTGRRTVAGPTRVGNCRFSATLSRVAALLQLAEPARRCSPFVRCRPPTSRRSSSSRASTKTWSAAWSGSSKTHGRQEGG